MSKPSEAALELDRHRLDEGADKSQRCLCGWLGDDTEDRYAWHEHVVERVLKSSARRRGKEHSAELAKAWDLGHEAGWHNHQERKNPPMRRNPYPRRVGPRDAELTEEGRRLATQRDDLIAQGVDPGELEAPL